ncbi:50S ribosomal protein L17 [bacterium]|nr:50S ribosomal protein L17 [bacterium]
MRHRKSGRRLGVPMHRRKAMMKQLVEALFLHGRIKTTLARAKETRSLAEKFVTLAKKGTLHHRRQAMAFISRKDVVNRLFDTIAEWYKERKGGYTRIIKIGPRKGDAASVAYLEMVDWISGDKLLGQLTKLEKSVTGEDESKGEKEKEKEKKEKKEKTKKKKDEKKTKTVTKKKVKKVVKSPEKEKKISERKVEKEKTKKERATEREKVKKEKTEKKPKTEKTAKKVVKKVKKVVKKTKKKAVKKKSD